MSQTGKGVRVGIIDTGIDYTHADFGGPGTVDAFTAAGASNTFTPTAKVVGGYDFAGDAYNADPASDTYDPIPQPDPNPLDCNGHGSHVAGTTAGLRRRVRRHDVRRAATARTSTRPASTSAPASRPRRSLYALKVFGCDGSTNVVGRGPRLGGRPQR